MKKILITVFLFNIFINFSAAENLKIAVVDVFEILDNSVAVKKIKDNFEKIKQQTHKEFSEREIELKAEEDAILSKKGIISDELFEKERSKFYKKVSEIQREAESKKRKLEHAHSDAMTKIDKETISIIKDIAQKKKIALVLPSTQLLYSDEKLYITRDVIEKLNQTIQEVKIDY